MLNEYKCKFKVTTFDIDFLRKITPKAILSYMEQTATEHANTLGFNYEESLNEGFYWVLRSTKYIFKKTPMINDELEIKTAIVGFSGLKTLRRFEFMINQEVIGYGYNYWLMVGINNKKPFINKKFLNIATSIISKDEQLFKLNRLRFNEKMTLAYKKRVMNNDIDMNYHVNNVKYAEIIFNALPINILQENTISSMHIDYLRECKLDDIIKIYYKIDHEKVLVEGKLDEIEMFKSIIELKEKKK